MIVGTILKAGVAVAASVGVEEIVMNAVKMVTPANLGKAKRVCVYIGGLGITLAAGDMVANSIDRNCKYVKSIFDKKRDDKVLEEKA